MIGFFPLIVICPRKKQGARKFHDDLSDDRPKKDLSSAPTESIANLCVQFARYADRLLARYGALGGALRESVAGVTEQEGRGLGSGILVMCAFSRTPSALSMCAISRTLLS